VDQQDHAAEKEESLTDEQTSTSKDRLAEISGDLLDRVDSLVYAIVGLCFLIAAICALAYSFWDFITHLKIAFAARTTSIALASSVIQFVSELLLVLIIMEVLGTIVHYLKSHTTSLRPFLFIGIVSATRSILSIGARLSIEQVSGVDFTNSIIELGVNAAVILALGITLKLLGKYIEDQSGIRP